MERCVDDKIPFEIPDSWEWVRFGNIINLQSGQDLTPDKYTDKCKGIPYITGASNIVDTTVLINRWTEFGRAFAYKGDLLLTCKGTVGTMAFLNENQVHIARQIMSIHPYNGIDAKYVRIVLETLVEELKAAAKSMIPGISREDVLTALFPLPPSTEQRRIAEMIDIVSDPIGNL
ncbi:MAG: restriction endonuclease subunit S [Clostridiales bacterium]|nr:restriction endonuclease subunit S [Clostridiales bacterium]